MLSPQYPQATLSAIDSAGTIWTLVISETADQGSGTLQSLLTLQLVGGGEATEQEQCSYQTDPYSPIQCDYTINNGSSTQQWVAVVTSFTPPANLIVGDSGQLFTENLYLTVSSGIAGNQTGTYSVVAYSPSAVELQINVSGTANGNFVSASEAFAVDTSGNVTLISYSLPLRINGAIEILTFT
jgi:hypothetical protein